jgi:hypothetical protein
MNKISLNKIFKNINNIFLMIYYLQLIKKFKIYNLKKRQSKIMYLIQDLLQIQNNHKKEKNYFKIKKNIIKKI